MKVEASKRNSTSTPRGRGTYASQACTICRGKKTKCDGNKPVCGPCVQSGRKDECSWGKETGRRPRTEAHFEAMRKRAEALEEYVTLLESELEQCRRDHGSSSSGKAYLQFRPKSYDEPEPSGSGSGGVHSGETSLSGDLNDADGVLDDEEEGLDDEQALAQELCLPTSNLKLTDEGNLLLHHGNTAPFRFAQESPIIPAVSRFPRASDSPKYELLLDEAEVDYNPDFDWARFLPSNVPLDRKEHDRLLDLCFKFFTSWCLRIVPDLFLQDMHRVLSSPSHPTQQHSQARAPSVRTTHYSPMLHNALMSVASAFSDTPGIRDLKARQAFATQAKSYIEAECQQPTISVVHALSLLGSFHSGLGEQTLGYLYFGMSARISQALGLSIDCSGWVKSGLMTEHDMFDRSWAYWTIFTQDVCWSLYVGREFSIPASEVKQRISVPQTDPQFDSIPWHHPQSNIPAQANHLSATFKASCELLIIARRIMDVVNGLNNASMRQEINIQLISDIDLQLNTWKSNLPSELEITLKSRPTSTPHRLMMHCTYWWFFILLHRPFYHRRQRPVHSSDREIDHVKLCKRAAENIVELLSTWRSLYTLRYAPITLVQTVFSAGTIYLLIAVQAATGVRVAHEALKHALSQAQLCIQYLMEIGKSWQCATNIAEILKGLLQEQLKPALDKRPVGRTRRGPTPTPPHTVRSTGSGSASLLGELAGGESVTSSPSSSRRRRSPSTQRRSRTRGEDLLSGTDGGVFRNRGRPTRAAEYARQTPSTHTHPLPSPAESPTYSFQPALRSSSISVETNIATAMNASHFSSAHSGHLPHSPSWGSDDFSREFGASFGQAASVINSPIAQNARAHSLESHSHGHNGHGHHHAHSHGMHSPTMLTASDADMEHFMHILGTINVTNANASLQWSQGGQGSAAPNGAGMDPSSFLAMLSGEPLSNAPFLPTTYDSYDSPPQAQGYEPGTPMSNYAPGPISPGIASGNFTFDTSPARNASAVAVSGVVGSNEQVPMDVQDTGMAVLTQMWN